jgi:antitoxin HicB
MTHYIALIHKEADSSYGVSFPDLPGIIAAAESLDEALSEASDALAFAAESWTEDTGEPLPSPRNLDALRSDPAFRESAADAVVAAIALDIKAEAAE